MAKAGFIYYSVDTNRYQDIRIKKLKKHHGRDGVAIYDYILCEIYRVKGYFIVWDESTAFDVTDYWGMTENAVKEIVKYCGSVGLFNQELLSGGVITSAAIQTRFLDWSKKAKRSPNSYIIQEKHIILPEECIKIPEEIDKEKESKEKESKEKEQKGENYARDVFFENLILEFFGFNEISHLDKLKLISACCSAQFYAGRLDFFKKQFEDYQDWIGEIGVRYRHNFLKFMGNQANRFADGSWNEENWGQKLLDRKKSITQYQQQTDRGVAAVIDKFSNIKMRG